MIVIAAECRILQEFWQDFEEQISRVMPIVRGEKGCLRYDTFTSIEEPGLFIILEEWEKREQIDDHLATPHMKEHLRMTAPWLSGPTSLSIYEVSAKERKNLT